MYIYVLTRGMRSPYVRALDRAITSMICVGDDLPQFEGDFRNNTHIDCIRLYHGWAAIRIRMSVLWEICRN